MRLWRDQNLTFAQETAGGYLWSRKRRKNGARNPFYEFTREVAPGGIVLPFESTHPGDRRCAIICLRMPETSGVRLLFKTLGATPYGHFS